MQSRIAHSKKLNETLPGAFIEEKSPETNTLPTTMPGKKYKKKAGFFQAGIRVFDPTAHVLCTCECRKTGMC